MDKPATKNDIAGLGAAPVAPAPAPRRNAISGTPSGHKPATNVIAGNAEKPKRPEDEMVSIYSHVTGEHLIKRRAVASDYIRCRPDEKWSFQKPVDREAVDRAIFEIEGVDDKTTIDPAVKRLATSRVEELRADARKLGVSVDPLWGIRRLKAEIDAAIAAKTPKGTEEKEPAPEGEDVDPPVIDDPDKEQGDEPK